MRRIGVTEEVARQASTMASAGAEEEVLVSVEAGLGRLVLNRPRNLNALTHNMVACLKDVLLEWAQPSSGVGCVVIKGAGGKAFCAGGDVKEVVTHAMAGRFEYPDQFFTTEYSVNERIACLPLPYVALIDGITMGGGVGVSIHGQFRVATEKTVFAMPECGIGLFPDIGASYFLPQLPGKLGMYLAITGARLSGVTLREAGLATHYVPSSHMPQVEEALQGLGRTLQQEGRRGPWELGRVAQALDSAERAAGPLPQGDLHRLQPLVDLYFGHDSVQAMMAGLQAANAALQDQGSYEAAFVKEALMLMQKGSPLSQLVTFELMRRSRHASLETCLQAEGLMVQAFHRGKGDFFEGVSATLIDRGRIPNWKYSTLEEVPPALVEEFFEEGPFAKHTAHAGSKSSTVSGSLEQQCSRPGSRGSLSTSKL